MAAITKRLGLASATFTPKISFTGFKLDTDRLAHRYFVIKGWRLGSIDKMKSKLRLPDLNYLSLAIIITKDQGFSKHSCKDLLGLMCRSVSREHHSQQDLHTFV